MIVLILYAYITYAVILLLLFRSEFGPSYKSDCLPWITANCPEVLGEAFLAQKLAGVNIEDSKEVLLNMY